MLAGNNGAVCVLNEVGFLRSTGLGMNFTLKGLGSNAHLLLFQKYKIVYQSHSRVV